MSERIQIVASTPIDTANARIATGISTRRKCQPTGSNSALNATTGGASASAANDPLRMSSTSSSNRLPAPSPAIASAIVLVRRCGCPAANKAAANGIAVSSNVAMWLRLANRPTAVGLADL